MTITRSSDEDLASVLRMHESAFGPSEGAEIRDLVQSMLGDPTALPVLSLVAVADSAGEIVGHVLFTRAEVKGRGGTVSARLLAPLGVLSEYQRTGVGSALVREGLQELARGRSRSGVCAGGPGLLWAVWIHAGDAAGVRAAACAFGGVPAGVDGRRARSGQVGGVCGAVCSVRSRSAISVTGRSRVGGTDDAKRWFARN